MEKFDLLEDLGLRTNGDIYIGIVGPVRAGKSTFIKKFMEELILPNIKDKNDQIRTKDELPQSGAGRTITTAEPKFIPNEAVELKLKDNINFKVRIVDCVGFTVDEAQGYEDESGPRMVSTPWYDHDIPFEEAAELGTKKVISEHSTVGLVITTDGSITDISRESYIEAEDKVINELKEIGKPFIVVMNSSKPYSDEAQAIKEDLEEKHNVPVIAMDCLDLINEDIYTVLEEVLHEFYIKEIDVNFSKWIDALDKDHWLKNEALESVKETFENINKVREIEDAVKNFNKYDFIEKVELEKVELGTGIAKLNIKEKEKLFYEVLSDSIGFEVKDEAELFKMMKEFSIAKGEYDKIGGALERAKEIGYGIVPPHLTEMSLEEPEIIKKGNRFGVKLKASAPSIHMIKANIQTEVSPIIGTEKQSEELVGYLMNQFEDDTLKIWDSNIFGKSLNELVREGIQNKLYNMPESAQMKLKETLQRIINEGSGGLICIIL